jgi:hypothetical protein
MMFVLDPKDTRVILIGASMFEDQKLPSLPAIKDNNVKLRALLGDVVGISKDDVHILEDRDYANKITLEISKIVSKGLDIIYYAGHGLPHLKQLYLATKKTESDDPESSGALSAEHLVRIILKKSKAKRIIFIFDCCFSGFARENIDTKGKEVFLLTATSSVETAKSESPENENYTAFTHELLAILEQGIKNVGEILTLQDIFSGLKERLANQNLPVPRITSYGLPNELGICQNQAYQSNEEKGNTIQAESKVPPFKLNKLPLVISSIVTIIIIFVIAFFLFELQRQQSEFQRQQFVVIDLIKNREIHLGDNVLPDTHGYSDNPMHISIYPQPNKDIIFFNKEDSSFFSIERKHARIDDEFLQYYSHIVKNVDFSAYSKISAYDVRNNEVPDDLKKLIENSQSESILQFKFDPTILYTNTDGKGDYYEPKAAIAVIKSFLLKRRFEIAGIKASDVKKIKILVDYFHGGIRKGQPQNFEIYLNGHRFEIPSEKKLLRKRQEVIIEVPVNRLHMDDTNVFVIYVLHWAEERPKYFSENLKRYVGPAHFKDVVIYNVTLKFET